MNDFIKEIRLDLARVELRRGVISQERFEEIVSSVNASSASANDASSASVTHASSTSATELSFWLSERDRIDELKAHASNALQNVPKETNAKAEVDRILELREQWITAHRNVTHLMVRGSTLPNVSLTTPKTIENPTKAARLMEARISKAKKAAAMAKTDLIKAKKDAEVAYLSQEIQRIRQMR
jgi:hypothetical protein